MRIIEGKINGSGKKIGIVVSKFNEFITKRLLTGCLEELARYGVNDKDITIVWVPGAYEIPVVALKLAKKKNIHAVICLGSVIRGETLHYDLVAKGAADGIMEVSLRSGKPVIFGVLATDTVDLAYKRSEEKGNNKGKDSAAIAIEMIDVLKRASASSQ
jgi:6,7-dimethyl-8-ribityllumazine synthase